MSRTGRLENWQEVEWFGQTRLAGNVYDCEGYAEEGEVWLTNEIVSYHNVPFGKVAKTASGSLYTLGMPSPKKETIQQIMARVMEDLEAEKCIH